MLWRWIRMNLIFLVMVIVATPGVTIRVTLSVVTVVNILVLIDQELSQQELDIGQSLLLSLNGLLLGVYTTT